MVSEYEVFALAMVFSWIAVIAAFMLGLTAGCRMATGKKPFSRPDAFKKKLPDTTIAPEKPMDSDPRNR